MPPRVSVVMSVYNGERYLREAVDSILAQTFTDFEFLIIDDGSTDGTGAILAEYVARDPRIRVIVHAANQGLTPSLNEGLALAQGEYVARMDADDISLPERFARQVTCLDARPDIGVLGTAFQLIDADGGVIAPPVIHPVESGFVAWCLYFFNPLVHSSVMIRRRSLAQAGGYNQTLVRSQDHELWCRLSRRTRLSNSPEVLLLLRKHSVNVSSTEYGQGLASSVQALQVLAKTTLRRAVPTGVIRDMYTQNYPTSHSVQAVASLIARLYWAMCTETGLTELERRLIRADASERLAALFIRLPLSWWDWRRWAVLIDLCRMEPATSWRCWREWRASMAAL